MLVKSIRGDGILGMQDCRTWGGWMADVGIS